METNQDLYRQAILDAKAVRETAMAAARTTLAEHFEPKIREMMSQKLSEDMEENIEENIEEDMDESMTDGSNMEESMDDKSMDESTLDKILAELESLSEDMEEGTDESIEEGHIKADGYDGKKGSGSSGYDEKAKTSHGDKKLHEADDEDAEEEAPEGDDDAADMSIGDEEGPVADSDEMVELTVGDLKDIIRDVFMQMQGGAAPEGDLDAGTEMAADLGTGDEKNKEITLEEILAELEEEESKMEENVNVGAEITHKRTPAKYTGGEYKVDEAKEKMEEDLEEAVKTIKALKAELNEVNLFNAKMLYVNKIFKAKNLNEAQKTKVINAFDRVVSVKEVENTYKTLMESLGESKKSSLKESIGFASKPIGNAPARPIVEADTFVNRWQVLAGIK
jgi:hypothetical protein